MKLSSYYGETRFIYFFFNNTFFLDLLDLKYNELHIGRSCLPVGTFYFWEFRPLRPPTRETRMKSRFMNKVKYTIQRTYPEDKKTSNSYCLLNTERRFNCILCMLAPQFWRNNTIWIWLIDFRLWRILLKKFTI